MRTKLSEFGKQSYQQYRALLFAQHSYILSLQYKDSQNYCIEKSNNCQWVALFVVLRVVVNSI